MGGGVAGLTAAFDCIRAGLNPLVIEAKPALGGLIATDHIEGCHLEAGPDSCISIKPALAELAADVGGLEGELISSDDKGRTVYIVKNGALHPLPHGMSMMAPTDFEAASRSALFSQDSLVRLERELHFTPLTRLEDISIADFVTEHFGTEVLEYIAEPLLAGVYGGDVSKLSTRAVLPRFLGYEQTSGSLIRALQTANMEKTNQPGMFVTFRHGMQTLTDRLQETVRRHAIVVHANADSASHDGDSWTINAGDRAYEGQHLIVATSAFEAARLLANATPEISSLLNEIPYASSIVVTLAYRQDDVEHPLNGSGFLVPRRERNTLAACTWVHRKWPTKVAAEFAVLRGFIVDPEATSFQHGSDETLVGLIASEFRNLLGIRAKPAFHTVRRWPHSMPQYVVGHSEILMKLDDRLRTTPTLHLAGNAYDGVGLPDAIRLARTAVRQIVSR